MYMVCVRERKLHLYSSGHTSIRRNLLIQSQSTTFVSNGITKHMPLSLDIRVYLSGWGFDE